LEKVRGSGGKEESRLRVAVWGTGTGSEAEEEAEKQIDIIGGNRNSTDSSRVIGLEMTGRLEL